MLKKKYIQNKTLNANLFITTEDSSSDRDFAFSNTLDVETLKNINKINDFEVAEYKPVSSNIEFDLFFLRYILPGDIDNIATWVETDFKTYSDLVKASKIKTKSEFYEIQTADGLMAPKFANELTKTAIEIANDKPYVVDDPLIEIGKAYPAKMGYPHFYSSFTLPFWDKKDVWKNLKYGFNNKTYMYNSFFLIELYDSTDVEKQKRVTTIPVYVSDRYMFTEKANNAITQKRPVFNLIEGVDGYSLFFLKKYKTTSFYAKFYFWDALNGKKIQFIPSAKNNKSKKWLQNVETFDQKSLYLKYELDYTNQTYKIYDLNKTSGLFNIEVDHIDLYELGFDDYWSKVYVPNNQPTNTRSVVVPKVFKDIAPSSEVFNKKINVSGIANTIKKGLENTQQYKEIDFKKQSESVYFELNFNVFDEYNPSYDIKLVNDTKVYGNYLGYINYINTNADKKSLGLLNTTNNLCVDSTYKSNKRPITSISLKNVNFEKKIIIDKIEITNAVFSSDVDYINYDIKTTINSKLKSNNTNVNNELFSESIVLPKLTVNVPRFETLESKFKTDFKNFVDFIYVDSAVKSYLNVQNDYNINSIVALTPENTLGEDFVITLPVPFNYVVDEDTRNSLYQKCYCNEFIFLDNLNKNAYYNNSNEPVEIKNRLTNDQKLTYTNDSLRAKITTEPEYKTNTYNLVAQIYTDSILYEEEALVVFDLYFGESALIDASVIKELNIKANLEVTYYDENTGIDKSKDKITIPINVTLK